MKIMYKSYIIILIITVYNSCSSTGDYSEVIVDALIIESSLKGNVIPLDGRTEIFNPRGIANIDDNYLLIIDQREEGIFQVFKIPELEFLYSWGRRGRGPNEFQSHSFLSINTKNDQLILYDLSYRTLQMYKVSEKELKLLEQTSLYHDYQKQPLNRILRINDSLYVARSHWTEFPNKEFVALRPDKNEPLYIFGEYPDMLLEPEERYNSYGIILAAKSDGSRFVSFYGGHNRFKIFDNQGDLIIQVRINDKSISDRSESNIIYRVHAVASDEYIYTLSLNTTEENIIKYPDEVKPILEIWNWDGEQIHRSMFDRLVTHFTVSEYYGKLYALSVYEMNKIFEYDIPDVKYSKQH